MRRYRPKESNAGKVDGSLDSQSHFLTCRGRKQPDTANSGRARVEGESQVKWTRDPGVLIRIIGFLMGVIVAVWLVKNGSPVR
jgi:hypothetical protein